MERWTPSGPLDDAELARLYEHGTGCVRANFVSTIDGGATGDDGRSGSINNDADLRVFEILRAVADVVLIGAGTTRTEGYGPVDVADRLRPLRAELGLSPVLEMAVVTRSGILSERLLGAQRPPLVVTHAACLHLDSLRERLGAERVLVHGEHEVDLGAAIVDLGNRELKRVLAEGGPHLFGSLLAANLVDELCLTTSPMLVGGHPPRIVASHAWLDPAQEAHLEHVLVEGSTMFTRWSLSC